MQEKRKNYPDERRFVEHCGVSLLGESQVGVLSPERRILFEQKLGKAHLAV
jgi:hypothetical protein